MAQRPVNTLRHVPAQDKAAVPARSRGILVARSRTARVPERAGGTGERLPVRTLHFSADQSLGQLYGRDGRATDADDLFSELAAPAGWRLWGEAQGTVIIPAHIDLLLSVATAAGETLAPLAHLPADALYGIDLMHSGVRDAALGYLRHLTALRDLNLSETTSRTPGYKPSAA
jgi:hypothetical protein